MGRQNWTAVGSSPHKITPVDGFRSRYHASKFILELEGYWSKSRLDEPESRDYNCPECGGIMMHPSRDVERSMCVKCGIVLDKVY